MMPNDYTAKESIEMFDLAVKLRTAILYSIAQSLAAQFPPSEEPPPELRSILERIEENLGYRFGDDWHVRILRSDRQAH